MNITGIKLSRNATDVFVLMEKDGRWIEVIREPADAAFDHIVNESGMTTCVLAEAADKA